MQNIKKGVTCLILFSLFFGHLIAQKNNEGQVFYISKSKEAIKGFFDLEKLTENKIGFSQSPDVRTSRLIYPTDIEKIELSNGTLILPQTLSFLGVEEKIFVTTILIGEVNLFKGNSKKENEVFYISTTDKPQLKRINKSDPKTFFKIYFNDCPKVKPFSSLYTASSLKQAVAYYGRECYGIKDQEYVKEVKNNSSIGINVGVRASENFVIPTLKGWYAGDYKNQVKPNIGLLLRFDISNSLSIGTGFNFYNKKYEPRDSIIKILYGPQPNQFARFYKGFIQLKYQVVEIPFEITYRFYKTKSDFIPFISFAYSYWNPINVEKTNDYEPFVTVNSAGLGPYVKTSFKKQQYSFQNFALSSTFGLIKPIKNNQSVEFGLRYAYERERFDSEGFDINVYLNYHVTNNIDTYSQNKVALNAYNRTITHRLGLFLNYYFSLKRKNNL